MKMGQDAFFERIATGTGRPVVVVEVYWSMPEGKGMDRLWDVCGEDRTTGLGSRGCRTWAFGSLGRAIWLAQTNDRYLLL